jgi:membrane fusion protein, type I secretion system
MTKPEHSIRTNLWLGITITVLLVGSVGGWAATTDISGAVIAPGSLVVDSNVSKIQHQTGGVISDIKVRNGDHVKAGDVLVRLDATVTRANLSIVRNGIDEILARTSRLKAERDNRDSVTFPQELLARRNDAEVAPILAGERRLFELRHTARAGQKSQLRQRIVQLEEEVSGLEGQVKAKSREGQFMQIELKGARELRAKNLMPISRLTQLERESTRLEGERAKLISTKARVKGKIVETNLQIVQVEKDFASEVATELRNADAKLAEYLGRKVSAEDQLERIDIRAPIAGVVHQSTANTVGGVIAANSEPIMLIVPEGDRLLVEAKVTPQDRDQLHLGQLAHLRFQTFNQRTTPEINGTVSRISADAIVEKRSGASFYTVRISFGPEELERLGQIKLVPGMPVEAFLRTGKRKVISYLMKPIMDQLARAFRER